MYIYSCMYVHTYVSIWICTYILIHIDINVYVYMYIHYMSRYGYEYYVFVRVCMRVGVCLIVHRCVLFVWLYIRTHKDNIYVYVRLKQCLSDLTRKKDRKSR